MEKKLWNRNFIFVCIAIFLSTLGSSIGSAIISKKAAYLGATSDLIGMISSVASISALIFIPLASPFIDFFNKKYIYAIMTLIHAITLFGNAMVTTVPDMMVISFISGIGKGINATSALALVSDTIPEDKMTTGISYFTIFQVASQAFGPSIGLKLFDKLGYSQTFLISAIMVFVTCFVILFIPVKKDNRERKFKFNIKGALAKKSIAPAVMMVFLSTAYSNVNSFLVVYADAINVENIGLYFTVNTIVLMFTRPVVAKILEKTKERYVIIGTVLSMIVGLVLISIGRSLWVFIVAAVLSAIGYGSLQPMVQAMCVSAVEPERRGAASSTSYMGTNVGYLVGPTLGGILAKEFGYSQMFMLVNISVLVGLIEYFLFVERRKVYEANS